MNKLATAAVLVALVAGHASCKKEVIGEGPVSTQTRNVSNFAGIDLHMNGYVYYTNNPVWKVEVTAKQSIHADLETKVVNGRLLIRYYNGKTYDADERIRIHVSGPALNSFETTTSGSIYCQNLLQQPSLYLRSKGSGSIFLNSVATSHLDVECNASGSIVASGGSTASERLKTTGSGKIDFSSVTAKDVNARVVGSGDIKVKATDKLEARIDGSGFIYFIGAPIISAEIHGSGRLVRL